MNRFIFIFLLLSPIFLAAQIPDSLYQLLSKTKEDTNRVKLYNKIGNRYIYSKTDSALYYIDIAKKLSQKLNYSLGLLNYSSNASAVYMQLNKIDTALLICNEGLALAEKIGNKKQAAFCNGNIANCYNSLNQYDSAIIYNLKALAKLEEIKDSVNLLFLYGNVAAIFSHINQYKNAIIYAQKSLLLSKQGIGDRHSYVFTLTNIAGIYLDLKMYDSTILYANEAITISKQENDNYQSMASSLQNIIFAKISQKKYGEINKYILMLKDIKMEDDDAYYKVRLQYDYAIEKYYEGKYNEAEKFALKALNISITDSLEDYALNSYNLLLKIEAALHNYALADEYEMKADSINNKNKDAETAKNIQDLEKKYETQKKETEIFKLTNDNKQKSALNKIYAATAIAVFLISLLSYRNFRSKQKIHQQQIIQLEKEKKLQAVDAMLKGQEEERSRLAKDLHDGLGGMLSGVKFSFNNIKENMILDTENTLRFEKSINQLDNTIAELRKVAHNLMPEALVKFGLQNAIQDFCQSLQQTNNCVINFQQLGMERDLGNVANVNVYRIIQELVNNAVKYASAHQIIVQLTKTENKVLITVEDDGKGFDIATLKQATGIGITNITHRVNYLNGTIDITSKPNNGTSINIELNV